MGKVKPGATSKSMTVKKGPAIKQVRFNEEARTTSPTDGPIALAHDKISGINSFPVSGTHWFEHDLDDNESESSLAFGRESEYTASRKNAEIKGEIDRDTGNIKGPYARSAIVATNTDTNAILVAEKVKLFKKTVKREKSARSARSKTGKGVIKKRRQTKKRK
jgi:hypothetical protein